MKVDPTVAVRVCWTEADSVRYTIKIANCVSLRSSPVPSPALVWGFRPSVSHARPESLMFFCQIDFYVDELTSFTMFGVVTRAQ